MSAKLINFIRPQKTDDFYYVEVKDQARFLRVWVSRKLLHFEEPGEEPGIKFPLVNAVIETTQKGTLVLRPRDGYWTTIVRVEGGYRGGARVTDITPAPAQSVEIVEWASPRGSLGYSILKIMTYPSHVTEFTVSWERDGRLYGEPPSGRTKFTLQEGELTSSDLPEEDLGGLLG